MEFLKTHKSWTFSIIYFFAWAGYATFAMDFLFYSQKIGFSNTEIGILYSTIGFIGIMTQPLFGYISDYFKSTRKVLLASLVVGTFLSMLLSIVEGKAAVRSIVIIYTIFMGSFMPLLDNWVARSCINEERAHFGSIRLWGSLGFAIVAYMYGRLTMKIDISHIYFSRGILFIISFILIYSYRDEGINKIGEEKKKPDMKALFSNKEYILFLVFVFFFSLPINAAGTFFPGLLIEMGGSNETIGFFSSFNAIIEIPFFLYVRKLTKRMGYKGLIYLGCTFMCLRLFGFIYAKTIPSLMVAFFCIAPYTSLFTPGMIYYIYSIAPKNTEISAQTIIQAFSIGFAGMLGNYFAGYIIDRYGLRTMYQYGTIICVGAVVIFFIAGKLTQTGTFGNKDIAKDVSKENSVNT